MNAQSKIEVDNVHRRLSRARKEFHATELKKSGRNTFANYSYFELGDFLVPALEIFDRIGLGATVSFSADTATMRIVNLDDPEDVIELTSPMGSAALKGCHEVQNIGAVETYQRRYLWVAALEIVEHDALDATASKKDEAGKSASQADDLMPDAEYNKLIQLVEATGANVAAMLKFLKIRVANDNLRLLNQDQYAQVLEALNTKLAAKVKAETDARAKEPA